MVIIIVSMMHAYIVVYIETLTVVVVLERSIPLYNMIKTTIPTVRSVFMLLSDV